MISSSALQKVKSLVTLVAFSYSLFTPLFNIAFAVAPTVNLTYSANPAGAGLMTVTATYSESIVGTPLISIDQPGTTDIVDATMLDLGTGSSWSYDYTVNVQDGSGFIDGTANVTLTGAYNGSGEIADPASNASFDIVTADITPPVVTLSGSTPITILSGSVFNDDGATWTDNMDGTGVISAYNSGTLDVNNSGSYLIGYVYVDAGGNTGSVDRVVNVVETDITAPVVTLSGSTPMNVEYSGSFVDPGAIWIDNIDGAGTIGAYNSGTLDINTLGTYTIGYVYVDAAGNTGSAERTVNVVDMTAPVLTLSGFYPELVLSGGIFIDDGASWTDNVDGSGVIANYNSGTLDVNNTGAYLISYMYVDAAGNTGTVDRLVIVYEPDSIPPVVTLSGSSPVSIFSGGVFVDEGATWTDNIDGSGVIANYNSGTLDVNNTGSYLISYVYFDGTGNRGSVDRIVNVVEADVTAPIVTITGFSPFDVEYAGSFVDPGATWTDNIDGTGTIGGYNSGSINTGSLGSYTIGYVYTDAAGNTGSADRTVNVVDTTAPVLTLSGASPVTVFTGGVLIDEGATWSDAVDGTGVIASYNSGTIDVNNTGSYLIGYVYVDAAGNTGSVDRVVNVVIPDFIAPIITLNDISPIETEIGEPFVDFGATWTDNVDGTGTIIAYNSGYINTGALGTYTIAYVYTDAAGNTGSAELVVNVIDSTRPVVTLSGSNPVIIFTGGTYLDEGANWTDNVDGSGIISTYNSGMLDVNNSGTYHIGYYYVDSSGNTGNIDRMVQVVEPDYISPNITLIGYHNVNTELGGAYGDLGASWTDNVDGTGFTLVGSYSDTGSFAYSGFVDTNTIGTYQIEYLKVDSSGNQKKMFRTVNVVDTTTPTAIIEQKLGQPDPTYTGSALYVVTFSEPINVSTFTSGALSFSGSSASGLTINSINEIAPFDGTTFEVEVTAISTGSIVLSIPGTSHYFTTSTDLSSGIAIDGSGNIYTADYYNDTVSKITPDGVSNILGSGGSRPLNIVVDNSGNVFTLSDSDSTITKITPGGFSSVFGNPGFGARGLVIDNSGNLYTAKSFDDTVIKFTSTGASSTLGTTGDQPSNLTIDGSGNVFTINSADNTVTKITSDGVSSLFGTASIDSSLDLTVDDSGNIYTLHYLRGIIGKITPLGVSSILGTTDLNPYSITTDNSGNIYVLANLTQATITKITPSGVSTIIGKADDAGGGIVMDGSGNFFIDSLYTNIITKVTPGGIEDLHGNLVATPSVSSDNSVSIIEIDSTSPNITLVGISPIDVEFGTIYNDSGATWTDNFDGSGSTLIGSYGSTGSFASSGTVDSNTLGSYSIEYKKVDTSGNSGSVIRTVNVVDTTAPVVTLSGSTPVTILSGSVFTDEGATWSDVVDGGGTIVSYNSGILDVNNTGAYLIGYVYTDAAGNTGSVDRVVNVVEPDVTPPVLTLSGSSPIDIEFGGPYVDDGATWTDNVDGSGFIAGFNSGSVDVEAIGAHVITYLYVDMAGNTGSVDRIVNIVDTTAPVVTLSGSSPVTIFTGGVFIDEGATWSDVVDGGGTIVSYNSGILDVNNTGAYLIGYVYVDAAGNTGSVDRVVNVVEPDVTPPVLTLSGSSPIDVEYAGSFVDDGATWTDNVDGSGTIGSFNSGSLDVNTLGTYLIGYVYVDLGGNTGSVDRVVNVVDTTAPALSLSGVNPVNIFSGGVFIDEGATWSDAVDGTGVVATYNSGSLDVNNTGSYLIGYIYVDSSGNTGTVDRVVNVMDPDTTPPTVTLYGISPIDIEFGSIYTDLGAEWSDNFDGTGNTIVGTYGNSGSFAVSGSVDTNTLGVYTIEYYKVDSSGNAGYALRTVNVVDTTAPVVTLSGSTPVTVLSGSVFNDDGATWSDAVDGTGVILSATSGSVDVNTLGTYVVEYSYTDTSGNTGSTSRIINVIAAPDIIPPVVTLVGSTVVNVEFGSSFIDLGANWTDNVDGSGTISAYTSGSVNTGALGTYTISYEYVDGSGNTGSTDRSVIVRDTVVPTASIAYSNLLSTSGSVIATLTGSSEAITIVNNAGSPNYSFMANGSFTYIYIDASGNTGTTMATVNNIDTTPPVISIVGGSPITAPLGSTYIDQGATANDNISGNLTAFIVASGSVNTSLTGTYIVEYSVSDTAGNRSTVNRTVNVSPVVSAPAVYNIGGGGGGSAGSYVSYFSAPTNAFELNIDNQQSSSNSQSMTLGIANLQRLLNLSLSQEQHSEPIDVPIPSSSESTSQAFEPITEDIDGRVGETEIIYLIQRGIINNSSNFNPDRTMTRGEFIKIVSGFYESPSETSLELPFADIESDEMRKYIEIAYSYGLITRQNLFRPNDPITTGEAKTILMRSTGTSEEGNLLLSEKNTITRENGAIIIVSWLADKM